MVVILPITKFPGIQLQRLKQDLKRSKRAAFAEGTRGNLRIQWETYMLFCIYFDFQPLPATSTALALYAQFLSRSFKSVSAIKNYVSGVRTLHLVLDLEVPQFGQYDLKLALKGLQRQVQHSPRQALPITPAILMSIHSCLNMQSPTDATFWCLFVFAFFCLARKSNLVPISRHTFDPKKQLTRADIQVHEHCLVVTFSWTKTIQFAQKNLQIPLIPMPNSNLCPVKAYRRMVELTPGFGELPAFMLNKPSGRVPLTYKEFQRVLKHLVGQVGLDPTQYSSHSFRRGGATWAFKAGVPGELIKTQGDWSSDAYLRYLDMSLETRTMVAQYMVKAIMQTCT